MTKRKCAFTEFELKNLLEKTKTRDATDEESEILWNMYYERWGTSAFGRCLHPHWLLEDIKEQRKKENDAQEQIEVREWLQREKLDWFDEPDYEKTNPPITILCEKPDDCHSREKFGNACRCIRENFRTQSDFEEWQKSKLTELKNKIIKLVE